MLNHSLLDNPRGNHSIYHVTDNVLENNTPSAVNLAKPITIYPVVFWTILEHIIYQHKFNQAWRDKLIIQRMQGISEENWTLKLERILKAVENRARKNWTYDFFDGYRSKLLRCKDVLQLPSKHQPYIEENLIVES